MIGRFSEERLQFLLLLSLLAIAGLQPTLSGVVNIGLLILLKLREKLCDTGDGYCPAMLRRMIGRIDESQRWSRREEREQVGGELVGHRTT